MVISSLVKRIAVKSSIIVFCQGDLFRNIVQKDGPLVIILGSSYAI